LKHPLEFEDFRRLKFQSVIASNYDGNGLAHSESHSSGNPPTEKKRVNFYIEAQDDTQSQEKEKRVNFYIEGEDII
jgi:hypothetical protein